MFSTFLFIAFLYLNGILLQNDTVILFITKIDTVYTVIISPLFNYDKKKSNLKGLKWWHKR